MSLRIGATRASADAPPGNGDGSAAGGASHDGRRQRSASAVSAAATAGLARTAAKLARTAASVSSSDAVDTTA